jgi:hypothetical protein
MYYCTNLLAKWYLWCTIRLPYHRQPDLVPHLHNDQATGNYTSGSVQRSHGWRKKVTDNPNINKETRSQAISISADGVPLFKDRNAGSAWPFVARSHNLPDGLSSNLAYVHMVGFEMNEHKTWDEDKPEVVYKVKRYNKLTFRCTH